MRTAWSGAGGQLGVRRMDCELRVFFHEKFGEVRGGLIDG